jgi:hypothetical protein
MSGYGVKEARYNTRLAKQTQERVNFCGSCGDEIDATDLLCVDCRGTMKPLEEEVR